MLIFSVQVLDRRQCGRDLRAGRGRGESARKPKQLRREPLAETNPGAAREPAFRGAAGTGTCVPA